MRISDWSSDVCSSDLLETLRARLDDENRYALSAAIGGALRANAIGGALAGEIDAESYGLIHRPDADLEALTCRIEALARDADPEKRGIGVRRATVAPGSAASDADRKTVV